MPATPSALSPSDPLVIRESSTSHGSSTNDGLITQFLGGISYSLDPSKIKEGTPLWKRILKGGALVVASPVLVPTAAIYAASMYLGPQWWRHAVVSKIVPFGMEFVAKLFDGQRKILLKQVQPGSTVLDLGSGGGHYMKYLGKASHVVALEPVQKLHPVIQKRALEEAGLTGDRLELCGDTLEDFVAQNQDRLGTFDWVILGNVMCEVDHQQSTLQAINQLLKPGGHVYFSEHVASPKGTWSRTLQDCINPLWSTVSGGCNCNRDSLINIRSMPEWEVISWEYDTIKVGGGPFVTGLARKKEPNFLF